MKLSRRHFIVGAAALLAGHRFYPKSRKSAGSIHGASHSTGHRLRNQDVPSSTREERVGVVIVGGGIAGLSAAWRLKKKGYRDFVVLDLEREVGGNSRYGENEVSAYPWAAHYVPLAGADAHFVTEFFEDIGVITGRDSRGLPIYDEYFLCASPQERLFLHGRWQEGLIPSVGVSAKEREHIHRFQDAMESLKHARGNDGRPAFTIPVDMSSRDPRFLKWDSITMAQFLHENGYHSAALRWYVDYCCRDDYGAGLEQTSAWAGVHYFASRAFTASNAKDYTVLTWPEGNGFLVKKLKAMFPDKIRCSTLATKIDPRSSTVLAFDVEKNESYTLHADAVVYAGPRFTVPHVIHGQPALNSFEYAPWMVANLTLDGLPESEESELAWDNVLYDSRSLGYINATHQNLERRRKTVLTYYRPLDDKPAKIARAEALAKTHESWRTETIRDLRKAHPHLEESLARFDVWIWGHGMIRPSPGFLWGDERKRAAERVGNVRFAHSDMSGLSIFEEAQYRGVNAADDILRQLGGSRHG